MGPTPLTKSSQSKNVPVGMVLDQYTWIFVLSIFAGFVFSFGLGANDMANSFATSVGSKAITIFQAVIIAGIFEFLGAVLLGSSVTSTIKSGIAKSAAFSNAPELLMFGFFAVMVAGATWDLTATRYGFPVSPTHTVSKLSPSWLPRRRDRYHAYSGM